MVSKGRKTSLKCSNTAIRRSKRLIYTPKYSTRGSSNKRYRSVKGRTCQKRRQNTVNQKSNYKNYSGRRELPRLLTTRKLLQSIDIPQVTVMHTFAVQHMTAQHKAASKMHKSVVQNMLENTEGAYFENNCDFGDEDCKKGDQDGGIIEDIDLDDDIENCCVLHEKYVPLLRKVQKLHPIGMVSKGEEISHTQANKCSKPLSNKCYKKNGIGRKNNKMYDGIVLLKDIALQNNYGHKSVIQHNMLEKTVSAFFEKNLNSKKNVDEYVSKGDQNDVISEGIGLNNVENNSDLQEQDGSSPFYDSVATSAMLEYNNCPDRDLSDVMALDPIHGEGSEVLKMFDQLYKQTFGKEQYM